jgi:tetratricopeptide (TPR) repeat protein
MSAGEACSEAALSAGCGSMSAISVSQPPYEIPILEIRRRVLGPEHPHTLASMGDLAKCFAGQGRYAEAEKLLRETREIQRRVLGPEQIAGSTYNLGSILARKGDHDGALSLLREAVDHGLQPGIDLYMEKDPDLKSLYGDSRFTALVAHAKELAAGAQRPK